MLNYALDFKNKNIFNISIYWINKIEHWLYYYKYNYLFVKDIVQLLPSAKYSHTFNQTTYENHSWTLDLSKAFDHSILLSDISKLPNTIKVWTPNYITGWSSYVQHQKMKAWGIPRRCLSLLVFNYYALPPLDNKLFRMYNTFIR